MSSYQLEVGTQHRIPPQHCDEEWNITWIGKHRSLTYTRNGRAREDNRSGSQREGTVVLPIQNGLESRREYKI